MVNFKGCYSHRIPFLFRVLILLILILPPFSSHASIRTIEGTVISVSDGDTFKVETPEGTKVKVRFYGIDAPKRNSLLEMKHCFVKRFVHVHISI